MKLSPKYFRWFSHTHRKCAVEKQGLTVVEEFFKPHGIKLLGNKIDMSGVERE